MKKNYWKWLCKNYTDENKNVIWCPNPKCDLCSEKVDAFMHVDIVECDCGTEYCFKCGDFAHRGASCEIVKEWKAKEVNESENSSWLAANTKPCPQCHHPIEKNNGCNVMICASCRHEFCWLCLNAWALHKDIHGRCTIFEEKVNDKAFLAEHEARDKLQADAKHELTRY